MTQLHFQLHTEAPHSRARAGTLTTAHGSVETPIFMPVGTQAAVKSQTFDSLKVVGSKILLANTYHLLLRPGPEVFQKMGGIHKFMNWDGPVLTDSGGFQIFSLPHARTMNEHGATFRSYIDGKIYVLSPEESISMQKAIGSDIMMVLDQCIPSTSSHAEAQSAMERTHRWAVRSLLARRDSLQALFGIVQGACYEDLRKQSADFLTSHPFDGFAVGGLAVGETKQEREDFTELTASLLPRQKPRYLMGVGTPIDILEAVHRGIDMFDCILPTALSQQGVAFTSQGRLQLRRSIYKFSEEAVDPQCPCSTCSRYSRAYLHHLTKAQEFLGWTLLSTHNLTFYHKLMRDIRQQILDGTFASYYATKRLELMQSDNVESGPPKQKNKFCLGYFEVHTSNNSFSSIKHTPSGEVMHSVSKPIEEAERLYVTQSRLSQRLNDTNAAPLVIWDVGLGAGANAMAALKAFEDVLRHQNTIRPLHLISFERDLDPLKLALKHRDRFQYLHPPAAHTLVREGMWVGFDGQFKWNLENGDFLERFIHTQAPDVIFFDPFSQKTDTALWEIDTFKKIFLHCSTKQTQLITYSASTSVRAALLRAGFFVAKGAATGPKKETTLAYNFDPRLNKDDGPSELLDHTWLKRWQHSDAKHPASLHPSEHTTFEQMIETHQQFQA